MIIDVNETTLALIKNPVLRSYADQYVRIYQDFMQQIGQLGIDIDNNDDSEQVAKKVAELAKKGAIVRNDGKSIYINRISPGCKACQTGVGSYTFFISLRCHRNCFFCFNPNQEDYEYYCDHTRNMVVELDQLLASGQRVQHLALTGGEPLLHKEETVRFFQCARRNFPSVYSRLYTCGDQLDHDILQALKDAGMSEIRFSIRLEDTPRAQQYTYRQIELARNYIPNVMVEMPVLPDKLDEMKEVLSELERLGIFGINLLEFCFPYHNVQAFRQRGYAIKVRPYRVLYNYWYAGGLPVAGSEMACLDLIEYALEEGYKLGVHYCSLENKHTGQIYQQNMKHHYSRVLYFSKKDYFLKSAKVFGKDVEQVRDIFEANGYRDYLWSEEHQFLEFHVSKVKLLRKLDVEIGISYQVIEERGGEKYLRELKLDVTSPLMFQLSEI